VRLAVIVLAFPFAGVSIMKVKPAPTAVVWLRVSLIVLPGLIGGNDLVIAHPAGESITSSFFLVLITYTRGGHLPSFTVGFIIHAISFAGTDRVVDCAGL
jgi:hypothetical protein